MWTANGRRSLTMIWTFGTQLIKGTFAMMHNLLKNWPSVTAIHFARPKD